MKKLLLLSSWATAASAHVFNQLAQFPVPLTPVASAAKLGHLYFDRILKSPGAALAHVQNTIEDKTDEEKKNFVTFFEMLLSVSKNRLVPFNNPNYRHYQYLLLRCLEEFFISESALEAWCQEQVKAIPQGMHGYAIVETPKQLKAWMKAADVYLVAVEGDAGIRNIIDYHAGNIISEMSYKASKKEFGKAMQEVKQFDYSITIPSYFSALGSTPIGYENLDTEFFSLLRDCPECLDNTLVNLQFAKFKDVFFTEMQEEVLKSNGKPPVVLPSAVESSKVAESAALKNEDGSTRSTGSSLRDIPHNYELWQKYYQLSLQMDSMVKEFMSLPGKTSAAVVAATVTGISSRIKFNSLDIV